MLKDKILFVAIAFAMVLSSCGKDETQYTDEIRAAQLKIDTKIIQQYIADQKLTEFKQSNGLFYQIINPGTGTDVLKVKDTLSVFYDGRVLGQPKAFDSVATTTPRILILGSLFQGLEQGFPLIRKGGKMRLIIPSTMAYINLHVGTIPPNSVLDFNINLVDVKPRIEPNTNNPKP